jgi:mono/diheme cytochrome c family protein
MTRGFVLAVFVAASGCNDCDLNRMIDQPKYTAYDSCEVCPNGSIMMMPPAGTVSRSAPILAGDLATGRNGTTFLAQSPLPVDRRVLDRGHNRFDIFCAACHGRLGDGRSQVAENMKLRKPANLLSPQYLAYPPGRIASVITEGYGLMRSYRAELPLEDRWAVVAYVKALQLSQHAPLAELRRSSRCSASSRSRSGSP